LVTPAAIGVLSSLRQAMVQVHQRPVVAVLATGDEIAELGDETPGRAIISSNSYTLIALIRSVGGVPLYLGIARDSREDLNAALGSAMKADLILTTGGVSMGDYDMVKNIMLEEGNSLVFWKVAMKPGKPLAFGIIGDVPVLGLPGNPVSTMTSFYQFARPAILRMSGATDLLLPRIRARLKEDMKNRGDRPHYVRGILERSGDDFEVGPTGPQGSGILSSMARGNCFMILPQGETSLPRGTYVECEIFQGGYFS
jgi:molybdopterin molybdotransferase